jgi:DNA-binding SARP family transcriptional activator
MHTPQSAPALKFLGGAVIQTGDTPLGGPAAHRHRLALLALLAVSDKPLSRDKLIAFLWPERDAEHGRNLLKVAVHELRKLIGENAIRTTGDQLSMDMTAVRCDAADFDTAVAAKDLEKAAALYGGPFLDGFFLKDAPEFERWTDGERTRLSNAYGKVVDQLAKSAEQRGDSAVAARWWRIRADNDPFRSDVALNLMRALAASGDKVAAIRHAEEHAARRREEIDVEPNPEIEKLAHDLAATPTATRRGEPAASTSLVAPTPQQVEKYRDNYTPTVVTASDVQSGDLMLVARPFTTEPERPARWRGVRWPVAIGSVIAVAAVAALVAVNARGSSASAGRNVAPNVVAVLPFRVVGSDSSLLYLREGMMDLLAVRLTGDGNLRTIDTRLSLAAARSAAPQRGEISLASALRVADKLGAGQLLLGDVVGGQTGVDLAATLYRVPNGEVGARATRTAARLDAIAPVVDILAAELLSRAAGEPEDRLVDLTRRPLPALRTYLAAQQSYRTGRYVTAESLFAKALDIDSTFGLAGLGLALANSWNTINEHYGIGRDAALRGQRTLGARDRAFLAAFFGPDPALGQPQPAPAYLKAWEDVVHKWPDFAEAWYHLGDRYYHFGGLSGLADPLSQARTAFQRALALDPVLLAPLHHLIEIYAANGEKELEKTTAARYFSENPDVSRDASAIGWTIATVLGDKAWLDRARSNFEKMPPSDLARIAWITQANGWPAADAERALSMLEKRAGATYEHENASALRYAFALNGGQPARALAAASAFEAQLPDQPIAALWTMYATIVGGDADSTRAANAVRRLQPFASGALTGNQDRKGRQLQARCIVGYWKAAHGDVAGARSDLRELQRLYDGLPIGDGAAREGRMCAAWLAASLAVDARAADATRLVAQLDTMVLRDRVPPRMSLSAAAVMSTRLHEKLGQLDLALVSSRWREHYTGHPVFLSTQLNDEARLAARTGDRDGAIRAYRHYLALRPAPEPGAATDATNVARQQLAQLERR